jgi:hypothetical protein
MVRARAASDCHERKWRRIMVTQITNRNEQMTVDQKLIAGLQKHQQSVPSLVIGGTSYKTADVITGIQTLVDSGQAVVSSRATWQANVASDKALRAKNKTFMSGVRQSVLVAYGNSIDVLSDFGLTPRKKPAPRTPEEKTASAAKAKATRAARHTMGKKQKAQIKGTVTSPSPSGGAVTTPSATSGPPPTPSGSTTASATAPAPASASATAPAHVSG